MIRCIYISLLIILAFAGTVLAQVDNVNNAAAFLQNGDVEQAKILIDEAIKHPETKGDAKTWYLRGFVYKELYKQKEANDPASVYRVAAIKSFRESVRLDEASGQNTFIKENRSNLQYLAAKLNNDAAANLNTTGYEIAQGNFELYVSTMKIIDPEIDLDHKRLEFYLALGLVYYDLAQDTSKSGFFEKTRDTYQKALEVDPNNVKANYQLAILYYNKAVDIIEGLDWDIEFHILESVQDTCKELAKKSLPYFEKAYALNPEKVEHLKGLGGTYYLLNEHEKYKEVMKKLEAIEGKSDE